MKVWLLGAWGVVVTTALHQVRTERVCGWRGLGLLWGTLAKAGAINQMASRNLLRLIELFKALQSELQFMPLMSKIKVTVSTKN